MAVTKILYRNGGLRQAIDYITNPVKTNEQLLTDYVRCDPGYAAQQMMDTKRALGKIAGRQCYHIIQSFKPDEITPELAHEIARQFAAEHLPGYEAVIATHVDKVHIHSHIVFNSVNAVTGKMYHSTRENYYKQIRGISDRLCKAHGLSIVLENDEKKAVSYAEWLRQKKSQPTFRSMLEADLHDAIEDANDLGHFFLLMEHKGYEIHHGNRLGFRLRGQEHFMCPERRNPDFSEERIEQAILGNLEQIEAGRKPAFTPRPKPQPRIWRRGSSSSMPSASACRALRLRRTRRGRRSLRTASSTPRPTISSAASMRSSTTWNRPRQWTVCSAVTWASAKRRSRCARR